MDVANFIDVPDVMGDMDDIDVADIMNDMVVPDSTDFPVVVDAAVASEQSRANWTGKLRINLVQRTRIKPRDFSFISMNYC